MTTDLGGLTARVGLNTTGLRTGRVAAESELVKVEGALLKTESAATRLGSSLGGLRKLAGAVVGFELLRKGAEGIKSTIQYAIDLEATVRRVQNVFGDSAGSVIAFSDTADKSLGRTKDAALQTTVRFGTLGTQFGETAAQAAKSSVALTKLATDLAASKGTSVDQAEGALATALVGRGRALRLYGVDVSAARVKEEALKEGLIRTAKDGLTPAITYQAAYNLILEQTARQQGYFAKNTDLTQEKLAIAKSTMRDASEELGVAFAPAAKHAADILAKDVAPALKVAGEGFAFLGDHKTVEQLVLVGGVIAGVAVGTAKLGKIYTETRDYFAKTLFGHAENAKAIQAEGVAAEVTATKLVALRDAELASGTAAAASAAERTAGSAFAGGLSAAERATMRGKTWFTPNPAARAGLGAAGGIGGGLILSQLADGFLRKVGADGKSRGGLIGGAEGLYSQVEQTTNPVSILKNNYDYFLGGGSKKPAAKATPLVRAPLRLTPVQVASANLAGATTDLARTYQAASDPATLAASASSIGVLGGAFDLLPKATKGSADSIAAANIAVANAQARVDKLRAGSGGASPASLASAQAAVLSAEDTLRKGKGDSTVETLRLHAAEDRLNTLRAGSKVNTKALATAESELVLARKKADTAAGSTALGVGDLFGRITAQTGHDKLLKDSARKLIRDGVSQPLLVEIEKLEKTAPGTLQHLAKTMTKAQGAALSAKYAEQQAQWNAFYATPMEAAVNAAKRKVAADAKALAAAGRHALASALASVTPESLIAGTTPAPKKPGRKAPPTLEQLLGFGGVTVNMPNATIVANDPASIAAAAARQARINSLAGRP